MRDRYNDKMVLNSLKQYERVRDIGVMIESETGGYLIKLRRYLERRIGEVMGIESIVERRLLSERMSECLESDQCLGLLTVVMREEVEKRRFREENMEYFVSDEFGAYVDQNGVNKMSIGELCEILFMIMRRLSKNGVDIRN